MRRTRIPDRTSNTSREPATRHRACIRSAPVNSAYAASAHEIDPERAKILWRDELVRDSGLATRAFRKHGAAAQPGGGHRRSRASPGEEAPAVPSPSSKPSNGWLRI
jgi:hypothetical protein